MKSFFLSKKLLIYTGLGIIVLILIIIGLNKGNGKQMATVVRTDVFQEVASTGKVKPNQSVDLGFDKSGRVGEVYVSVGQQVKSGQVLATLESGEISADLLKARGLLQQENIKLREMKSTSPISYNDASKNLDAAVRSGFADADNAVRNKADQFFKNNSINPQFEISITSGNFTHYFNVPDNTKIEINSDRQKVETILTDWQKRILTLNSSNVVSEADKAVSDLNAISIFLDKIAGAVNSFTSNEYAYDATVAGYKTTISGARSEVSGAISTIVTAKDKFNSAPTLGDNGQFEDIQIQEASVSQAEAAVSSLEASLAKSTIRAPFDGIVTLQEAKVGSAVSGGATLMSVISQNEMYIEANISEIHIGKLAVGNPASVTFDAFPAEIFSGEVSYIEPGDVIVDGVVNYKIRISLKNPDPKIKNGLTANIKIQTAKKANVLSLPLYAVLKEGDQSFVNKMTGKQVQKTPVTLGLSGNTGLVEILSGLNEGDSVQF
jgi:multidrug efflux pump subunit AcrA (membrane-fusion protein)